MTIDKYTRFILTVIACALLALVAQNAIGTSNAQSTTAAIQKVQICDRDGTCARVRNVKVGDRNFPDVLIVGTTPYN